MTTATRLAAKEQEPGLEPPPHLSLITTPVPNSPEYFAQFAEKNQAKLARLAETRRKFDEIQMKNGQADGVLLEAHHLRNKAVICELTGSFVVGICQGSAVVINGFPRLWSNHVVINSPDADSPVLLEPSSIINISAASSDDLPFTWNGSQA